MGKRIYPLNKIKYWYCYDTDDICRLYSGFKLNPKTILDWKRNGLETVDERNPALFYGASLIKFLGKMNESNKCRTAFDEMFCLKCKQGKKPLKSEIQLIPENVKFVKVKAVCQTCKNCMFKNYKLDDLQKIKRTFDVVQDLELYDSEYPPLKTTFFDQAESEEKESEKSLTKLNLFYENEGKAGSI